MTPEEFRAACLADGFEPPTDKAYPANDRPELHDHPFDARVLITAGHLTMAWADGVAEVGPGDECDVPAGTLHSEQGGPEGATGLLAIRRR